MLKLIAIVVPLGIAALFIFVGTKPNTFRIQRAASIKAPPDKIFAFINDFHNWGAWSPWEKMDPMMKRTHAGAAQGKGAIYEWDGNNKVGKGRMEIAESAPPSKVMINLDFLKPFKAHNTVEFTLEPQGESTQVTWAMQGHNPFMSKLMQVFVSLDRMVGKDFEAGLAHLKAVAERQALS